MNEKYQNSRNPSPEQDYLLPKPTSQNRTNLFSNRSMINGLSQNNLTGQQNFTAPNQSNFNMQPTPSKNVAQRRDSDIQGVAGSSNQKFMTPFSQAQNSHIQEKRTPNRLFGAGRKFESQSHVQIAALSKKRGLEDGQDENFFTPASEFSTFKPGLHDHRQSTAIRGFRNQPISNLAMINEASQDRSKSRIGLLKKPMGISKSPLFTKTNFNPQQTSQFGVENGLEQSFGEQIPNQKEDINDIQARQRRRIEKLPQAEQVEAITNIVDTIEDLAIRQADMNSNDLHIQLKKNGNVPTYEFEPSGFQPFHESTIPAEIQEEIENQQAKNFKQDVLIDNVVYFIVNTKLYLWEAISSHGQNMMHKSYGQAGNYEGTFKMVDLGKQISSICYVEDHTKNFKPYLVVVTEEQIELMSFMKKDFTGNPDLKSEINKNNYYLYRLAEPEFEPIALGVGEVVTKVLQVKKTGRILFASHLDNYTNSMIKELHLDGQDNRYITSVIGGINTVVTQMRRLAVSFGFTIPRVQENKKLKSSYPHEMSQFTGKTALQKVVPSPLANMFSDKKVAMNLQVDEQRNILYVLYNIVKTGSSEDEPLCYGPSQIDVYDMGTLGDHFSIVTTIYQKALARAIRAQYYNLENSDQDKDTIDESFKQLKIVSIHPITARESNTLHLLIVTKNKLRLYVGFTESLMREAVFVRDQERKCLQYDFLLQRRISHKYNIFKSQSFPNEEIVTDSYSQSFQPFALTTIKGQKSSQSNMIRDINSNSIHQQRLIPIYSSDSSSLIYAPDSRGGFQNQNLKICAISKNESAFCHNKEEMNSGSSSGLQEIPENLSVLDFEPTTNLNGIQEHVVALHNSSLSSFGQISEQKALNRLRMIGQNKALKLHQGWGLSNKMSYLPLDNLERQVYDEPKKFTVLTNKRKIEIVQITPFDQLIQILKQATRGQQDPNFLFDFETFAIKFPLQDVCTMLTQIFSEGAKAKFMFSKKIEKSNIASLQLHRKQQHQGFRGQPLQRTSGIMRVSTRNKPSSSPLRQPIISKQSRFGLSQTPQNQNNQIDSSSGPDYTLFPYIFKNSSDASGTSEIIGNCTTTVVNDERVTNLAKELLIIYGDCIKNDRQMDDIGNLTTIRSEALQVYLQRVLRPIWEMSITYRENDLRYECQTSNMEMFLPALNKLQNILAIIIEYQSDFTRVTTVKDQARLLNQSKIQVAEHELGIRNQAILEQGVFRYHLDPRVNDQIEGQEQRTILDLQFFVQRCIDVINFLQYTSFDRDSDKFESMMMYIFKQQQGKSKEKHQRDVALLKEISETKFKDFVLQGGSQEIAFGDSLSSIGKQGQGKSRLISKLFEYCTLFPLAKAGIRGTGLEVLSQTDKVQAIEAQTRIIQDLCPTLFTVEQTTKFVGESVLKQALNEKDPSKQNDLINHAIKQLLQNPTLIDMDAVVPSLCQSNNYLKVVQLCLVKIETLKEMNSRSQSMISSFQVDSGLSKQKILECQTIITGLVAALNQSITEQMTSQFGLSTKAFLMTEAQPRKGSKDYWRKLIFQHLSKLKSDNDVIQHKFQLRHDIFQQIEAGENDDLLVSLFLMIIEDSCPDKQLTQIPILNRNCFDKVCEELMKRNKFSITCLNYVSKLSLDESKYGNTMKRRLAELAIKLCSENNIEVIKSKKKKEPQLDLSKAKNDPEKTEPMYLTQEQKLHYCQLALENLPGLDAGVDQPMRKSYSDELEVIKQTLIYAKTVREEIKRRLSMLQETSVKVSDQETDFKASLKVKIDALQKHGNVLNSLNMTHEKLIQLIEDLSLYEMQFSYLSDQIANLLQLGYDHSQDEIRIKNLCSRIELAFEKYYQELILCQKMQGKSRPAIVKSGFEALALASKYCNNLKFQGINLNGPSERYDVRINKNFVLIMLRESSIYITEALSFSVLAKSVEDLVQGKQLIYDNDLFCLLGYLYRFVISTNSHSLRGIDKGSIMHSLVKQFSPIPILQSDPNVLAKTNNMKMFKDCCELVSLYLWTNPYLSKQTNQNNSSFSNAQGSSRVEIVKQDLLHKIPDITVQMRKILDYAQLNYPKPLALKMDELVTQINTHLTEQQQN